MRWKKEYCNAYWELYQTSLSSSWLRHFHFLNSLRNYLFALLIHLKFLGVNKPSKSDYRIQEYDDYQTERRIAAEIMQTVNRLALPFKLDRLTEGLGNCFPIAIIQQLRRPEIFSQTSQFVKMVLKHKTGTSLLRHCVKQLSKNQT